MILTSQVGIGNIIPFFLIKYTLYSIRLNNFDITNCIFLYPLRLCIIIINLEMKRITVYVCRAEFDLYQEARNYMTEIFTLSLVPEID